MVQPPDVLHCGRQPGDRAAAVLLHMRENAGVAEHEARRNHHSRIRAGPAAQRADCRVCRQLQAVGVRPRRGRRRRHWERLLGRQSLLCRRVPPLQQLQARRRFSVRNSYLFSWVGSSQIAMMMGIRFEGSSAGPLKRSFTWMGHHHDSS